MSTIETLFPGFLSKKIHRGFGNRVGIFVDGFCILSLHSGCHFFEDVVFGETTSAPIHLTVTTSAGFCEGPKQPGVFLLPASEARQPHALNKRDCFTPFCVSARSAAGSETVGGGISRRCEERSDGATPTLEKRDRFGNENTTLQWRRKSVTARSKATKQSHLSQKKFSGYFS